MTISPPSIYLSERNQNQLKIDQQRMSVNCFITFLQARINQHTKKNKQNKTKQSKEQRKGGRKVTQEQNLITFILEEIQ